ncbi:MAG: hypothetical protein IJA64_04215 [Rikenellaceae bacterium]|nr:hypothetical protein [Rikenellaceae bacterium]
METVVLVMMILVCFNYALKQTNRKIYSVLFSAAVCALFVGLMWPYAIEQSKSQISDWLADSSLMLDVAVILSLEVVIQMAFCILAAHIQTSGKVKPITIWIYRVLRWFPGVLIFPVLFSILVSAIFALPGVSFSLVAWVLAAIVFISIPLGSWILRWLLPEKEIRLELLFLANALIAILGVIATVNGQTAVAGISEVDWSALGGIVVLLIVGLVAGIIAYKIKLKRITKNK